MHAFSVNQFCLKVSYLLVNIFCPLPSPTLAQQEIILLICIYSLRKLQTLQTGQHSPGARQIALLSCFALNYFEKYPILLHRTEMASDCSLFFVVSPTPTSHPRIMPGMHPFNLQKYFNLLGKERIRQVLQSLERFYKCSRRIIL